MSEQNYPTELDGFETEESIAEYADAPEATESEDDARHDQPASRRTASRKGPDKALIRRVATKTAEVFITDSDVRKVAGTLLGVPSDDEVELAVAIMTATRGVKEPVAQINSLTAEAITNPDKAPMLVFALKRETRKELWSVLGAIGAADGELSAKELEGAMQLLSALKGISSGAAARLSAAEALLKRG